MVGDRATAPSAVARPPTAVPRSLHEVDAATLRHPPRREGMVPRTALLERLVGAADTPVIAIVGPAGYGKTALADQFVALSARRVAWLSLGDEHNDPALLLEAVGAALGRTGPVDTSVLRTRAVPDVSVAALVARRLAGALASTGDDVALVLDNAEALHNHQCADAVGELTLRLPPRAQLVVVSRSARMLPVSRLRARATVVEIGVTDLAMDVDEARALLVGAGARLSEDDISSLLERTEGWPVGLYLAALAHRAGTRTPADELAFTGDDRLMADYLRAEVLASLPRGRLQFLTRTSVLDRMSAALCDAVLQASGSGSVLEELEASNLLVVPLDRRRRWYRYHRLFRQLLLAELERREPDLVPELHDRASRWYERHDLPDRAIDHARAADDADGVARLVGDNVLRAYAAGHLETLRRWFAWIEERDLIDRYPAVAVLGAALGALVGQPAAAERRAAVAERADAATIVPDGSSFESWRALVRALLCRRGTAEMRRDARIAADGLAPGSRWQPTARALEGVAWLLDGELARADELLDRAVAEGLDLGAHPAAAAALAERAIVAVERGEWNRADARAAEGLQLVRRAHLEDSVPSALVFAVAARTATHRGDMVGARDCLAHASLLRPQLTYAVPFLSAQTLVELARTYLALADVAGARTVLREAADLLRLRPDLGALGGQVTDLRAALDSFEIGTVGASALTTAELRLVPLLGTHLSFPEIGERLHISRHTVKTQAVSLYRKLGVSSRSEAISCLDQIGLIGE